MTVLTILLATSLTVASETKKTTPPAKVVHCSQGALARKDCQLKLPAFQAQVSNLKINWNDGTWSSIADLPLVGDAYTWEKIELTQLAGRRLLQLWIWDPGIGEVKVQSLHWLVGEFKERQFVVHLNEVVRKREVHDAKPPAYSYDKMMSHGLKSDHAGIHWSVEKKTGLF